MVFFCPAARPPSHLRATPLAARNARFDLSGYSKGARRASAPLGREIDRRQTVAELGMTNLAVTRRFDHGPGVGVVEQGLEHKRVQAMAAAARVERTEDGGARKREVADRIERLVAHELVVIAQAFPVDDPVVADGDGV